jgi:hypothetical protein
MYCSRRFRLENAKITKNAKKKIAQAEKNAKNKRNGKVMIWKTKCKFGKLTKRILKTTQQIHQKQKCFQTQTARPLRQK